MGTMRPTRSPTPRARKVGVQESFVEVELLPPGGSPFAVGMSRPIGGASLGFDWHERFHRLTGTGAFINTSFDAEDFEGGCDPEDFVEDTTGGDNGEP
jgi:hypothetical protein